MSRRLAAAALVAAVALAGCSSDPDPEPVFSSGPDATAPAARSSSPTIDPSLTVAPADESAREFIRRFVALDNQMQVTGDTKDYLSVTGAECQACKRLARRVDNIYSAGGFIRTRGTRATNIRHEGASQWLVDLLTTPTRYRESGHGKVKTLPGGRWTERLYLAHSHHEWLVAFTEDATK